MNDCKIVRLDPARRRRTTPAQPPALSAMISDGVMHFPVERRQADIHDCDEMLERRRQKQAGAA